MKDTIPLITYDGGTGAKLQEWSSLIGIITAIVGNIFISFALNIQRYAHIRLNRDRPGEPGRRRKSQERSYGTQQSEIADERTQLNLTASIHEGLHADHGSHLNNGDAVNGNDESSHPKASLHSRNSSDSTTNTYNESESHDTKSYLSSPYWWAGILLMITGEAGNFLAYGFAPASIVSPLGVVALVSNCIIAPCLLKERFRQRDFWGVVVAVGGAVTVVLSARSSEKKMGPEDLWAAITRWEFELYLGITATLIVALMWLSAKYGRKSILIDLGVVGLFGGYTALSTKGVASLLSDTLWRALTFPVFYLLVLILVLSALAQIRYLNLALQYFDSTQVIPTQFVLFTLSVIIGSAVLFRDFESATKERFGKFFGGCALTFLGVYLITSGREKSGFRHEDDLAGDQEETIGLVDEENYRSDNEDEEDFARRRSKAGATFDGSQASKESRRSSRQLFNGQNALPQTPLRPQSYESSTFSHAMENSKGPETPILKNPWRSSEDVFDSDTRPKITENAVSSPLLPSETRRPSLRQSRNQAPRYPSPPKADRPSTLSRSSMSRMLPGPLVSPLSSPLSAIVADSLRRGVDSPATRRRPGISTLRKTRSQRSAGEFDGGDANFPSSPLKSAQGSNTKTSGSPVDHERSQSISDTLGEFFRIHKNRSKGKDDDGGADEDPGNGPSS